MIPHSFSCVCKVSSKGIRGRTLLAVRVACGLDITPCTQLSDISPRTTGNSGFSAKTASAKSDILPMRILALGYFSFIWAITFSTSSAVGGPALSPACTNVSHDLRFHPSGGNIPPPYPSENMVNTLEPSGPSHQNKVGTFTTRLVGLEPK